MERPLSTLCRSNVILVVAGLGYNLMILSVLMDDEAVLLADCACDWKAIKRIMDNMVRIRLNETNLLLLFEK